jgi:hypothetical protein
MTRKEWENYPVGLAVVLEYNVDTEVMNRRAFAGDNAFKDAVSFKKQMLQRNNVCTYTIEANEIAVNKHCDDLMDELNIPTEFEDDQDEYAR